MTVYSNNPEYAPIDDEEFDVDQEEELSAFDQFIHDVLEVGKDNGKTL